MEIVSSNLHSLIKITDAEMMELLQHQKSLAFYSAINLHKL